MAWKVYLCSWASLFCWTLCDDFVMIKSLGLSTLLFFLLTFSMTFFVSACRKDRAFEGMVRIPAGEFIMGSDEVDTEGKAAEFGSLKPWFLDEHPKRRLFLPEFYIDRFEVTNAQYKAFVDATKRSPPPHWQEGKYPPEKGDYPVVNVSWYEAEAYCRWVGKRLPTEEEWEKAARGNDSQIFPWGNEFDEKKGNVGRASIGGPTAVGSYKGDQSPFGVYDLAGNVMEWTDSWYKAYPGNRFRSSDFGEKFKVVRGDTWGDSGHFYLTHFTRSAYRQNVVPEGRFDFVGFRCAM